MSNLKRMTLLLTLIALAACSAIPDPAYSQNRQKWEDQHITHYRFELFISCLCVFGARMPVTIEVEAGKVSSITDHQGHPATDLQDTLAAYTGIEKLFDIIDLAHKNSAEQVNVEYNPDYGYPQTISIDYSKQVADDEIGFTVGNFQVLK